MIEFILDMINYIYEWVFGKSISQNSISLIESLKCMDKVDEREDYYDRILDKECVKEIYILVVKRLEGDFIGFKFKFNFEEGREAKTINQICKKVNMAGIDITKQDIKDMVRYLERRKK